jgi:hypothetical protein
MEPFKLMEPFTSLLITRNLERAPLFILTFVQRLLVRDHYLQVPRAQVEDVTEQHPACVLVAIVVGRSRDTQARPHTGPLQRLLMSMGWGAGS